MDFKTMNANQSTITSIVPRDKDMIIINLLLKLLSLSESLETEKQENRELKKQLKELCKISTTQTEKTHMIHIVINNSVAPSANAEVNFPIELRALQSNFEELKELLIEAHPDNSQLKKNLETIADSLDEVTPISPKEKLNKPLNKLGRLLHDLRRDGSKYEKIVSATTKGADILSRLVEAYNKVASFVGLA